MGNSERQAFISGQYRAYPDMRAAKFSIASYPSQSSLRLSQDRLHSKYHEVRALALGPRTLRSQVLSALNRVRHEPRFFAPAR
jgi:hypothetical protein